MTYTTIDDVRSLFTGNVAFPETKTAQVSKSIEFAEEYVRVLLQFKNKELSVLLSSGKLSLIVFKNIIATMVKRSIMSSMSNLPDTEVSNFSQTAGQYSISYSPTNFGSSLYLKREEKKLLGINNASFSIYPMHT